MTKDFSSIANKIKRSKQIQSERKRRISQVINMSQQRAFLESIKPRMRIQYNTFRGWIELIPKDSAVEIIIELDKPILKKEAEKRLMNAFRDYRKA